MLLKNFHVVCKLSAAQTVLPFLMIKKMFSPLLDLTIIGHYNGKCGADGKGYSSIKTENSRYANSLIEYMVDILATHEKIIYGDGK